MKLYLLSWGFGSRTGVIKEWIQKYGNKLALIPNARDAMPEEKKRGGSFPKVVDAFNELGFDVSVISLTDYFGKEKDLAEKLKAFPSICVAGGDCFVLRRAMKLSGFDNYLLTLKNIDNILYIGASAGMCVMSGSLKGLELVDNPNANPYGRESSAIYEGLGFLNYLPVPHYKSDHKESEAMNTVVDYLNKEKLPYKALRDGEIIIKDTRLGKEEFYGIV